jgi:ubiquinone biosynthesis protein Coq4
LLHVRLYKPRQIEQLFSEIVRGWKMGRESEFFFGERFDEHWQEPLSTYRMRLRLG